MIVPELPEVESARAMIERAALHRTIADVDDRDRWECRPHAPGEIRAALVGRRLDLRRRVDTLDDDELTTLHRALRTATRAAIRNGGVHTGVVVPHRRPDGHCPRCGAAMARATVGGRTTWFCPTEQG